MPKVTMPQLGESVAEGTIGRWLKQIGDHVEKYEPLVEVITDKVNAEVPSPFAGELREILVEEGATVPNGAEIAVIAAAGEAAQSAAAPSSTAPQASGAGSPAPSAPAGAPPAPSAPSPAPSVPPPAPAPVSTAPAVATSTTAPVVEYEGRVTPAVRRLAREHEIDLALVPGTGHGGRVTREDVMAYVERQRTGAATAPAAPVPPAPAAPAAPAPPPAAVPQSAAASPFAAPAAPATIPVPPGPDDYIKPMTQMRRGIAAQMTRSLAAPHAHLTIEVDMSSVVALRERVKGEYQAREGIGLSYVAFVTKAAVEGLRRHPDLNSHWTDEGLLVKRHVNIGIAVALDDGLIVPVVKDADLLSINGLNHAINDLAERARTNRLRLDDLQGGTFTVDNTGWFGSIASQPIVNVPEIAILTMEAIVKRPVVIETPEGDTIGIRPRMNVCMSWDHRASDGAQIGRFVVDVRRWLESVGPETSIW